MNEQIPSVDFVILSWNRSEFTIETLQSILSQKNIIPEICVVDQGSESKELEKLKGYISGIKNIHLIENGINLGVPAGRNQGMRSGNNEFIFCLDNDAVFESSKAISETILRFQQDNNIAVIGFQIKQFRNNLIDYGSWVYPKPLLEQKDNEFITTRFCGAGHALRRAHLEKTNFYDESLFFYWEELDLSYQLINLGFKIIYFPRVTILHKVAREGRVSWDKNRFYYLVRNVLYLDWKYYRSILRIGVKSTGYLVKGFRNHVAGQAWKGIIDAIQMCSKKMDVGSQKLSKNAIEYIRKYDTIPRGNFFTRIKNEVLGKLQGNS